MNKFKLRLNKIYNYIFKEKFYKKINIDWSNFPNRSEIIQNIIDYKDFKSYLEIGCDNDLNFNKIKIQTKLGVDPVSGGNIRKTSDEFFSQNKFFFDCIFIDGLHEYNQAKRDILNSIEILNKDGIIILHDCLPPSISHQRVPRTRYTWNGDVWKAIVEARTWEHVDTYTVLSDQGLGLIKKEKNSNVLNIGNVSFKKLKYKFFYENYSKIMRTISYDQILEII